MWIFKYLHLVASLLIGLYRIGQITNAWNPKRVCIYYDYTDEPNPVYGLLHLFNCMVG